MEKRQSSRDEDAVQLSAREKKPAGGAAGHKQRSYRFRSSGSKDQHFFRTEAWRFANRIGAPPVHLALCNNRPNRAGTAGFWDFPDVKRRALARIVANRVPRPADRHQG